MLGCQGGLKQVIYPPSALSNRSQSPNESILLHTGDETLIIARGDSSETFENPEFVQDWLSHQKIFAPQFNPDDCFFVVCAYGRI